MVRPKERSYRKMHQDYSHDIPSSNGSHIGNIPSKHVTVDAWNTTKKVGRDVYAIIDEVAKDKLIPDLLFNNEIIKTSAEPWQRHQRKVFLEELIKEIEKCMRELLEENSLAMEIDIRIHLDPASFFMAIDKEF